MSDPELAAHAQRAALRLEQSWDRWRRLHGLAAHKAQPVSSYVGYSLTEPWGQPRVVFGIAAEEAEHLAALLEHDECADPRYRQGLLWEPESRERPDQPGEWRASSARLPEPASQDVGPTERQPGGAEFAADLASWASGELPGQACTRLASWPAPNAAAPPNETAKPRLTSPLDASAQNEAASESSGSRVSAPPGLARH